MQALTGLDRFEPVFVPPLRHVRVRHLLWRMWLCIVSATDHWLAWKRSHAWTSRVATTTGAHSLLLDNCNVRPAPLVRPRFPIVGSAPSGGSDGRAGVVVGFVR